MSSFREESRKEWSRNSGATVEDLNLGCLQRIADATELMAREYARLVSDRDRFERWYKESKACSARLARSNAALRGQITKLKRKGSQP